MIQLLLDACDDVLEAFGRDPEGALAGSCEPVEDSRAEESLAKEIDALVTGEGTLLGLLGVGQARAVEAAASTPVSVVGASAVTVGAKAPIARASWGPLRPGKPLHVPAELFGVGGGRDGLTPI